ncbi:universal stress protein [Brevundimonas sp.]|uniref:universal stress protein n=1 Tax=Brevundimonas sp. TaxID=1871086 RepID=UPI003A957C7E|tara:strand:+ start:1156 stop:2040 length:885 start_codon:yes stop_codon:yes gene_type:complete
MTIKSIVVALSLEDDGPRIADRAVQLANQHSARLVAVHVVEGLDRHATGLPVDPDALATMIGEESARKLRSLLTAATKPALIQVETGRPHAVIEAMAASHSADLIIIGPGTAKSLREKVFGSTADRVVRGAPCPVLVVRSAVVAPYRHVAIGVDFSEHSRAAALSAARLAPMATRELIHGYEIPLVFKQALLQAGTSQAEIAGYRRSRTREARLRIRETFGEKGRLPPLTRIRIVPADPAIALLNASRRRGTDLVALGTQGANAVAQHLLGSVARKVLTGARCDVLVVPAASLP